MNTALCDFRYAGKREGRERDGGGKWGSKVRGREGRRGARPPNILTRNRPWLK